ncbi:hypothetical protein HRR83_004242 [Exophiala dermatitidis]|uniref:Uncharacterized protein n=1 Tax=Exophiala dermatitidis TaxID=5970 RepID=A0AAN6ETL1_EXODE|nr:hypothetical protein HRR73_006295 [Exophiala dermatitidis]KAJ4521452.1 hypothetical protein HRR74_003276 [Exophiala dermatitidis]KAJ4542126.1 hypothetical protein HRR77_006011 [Exophiala dermatitidis]KAJ4544891.1 hypothetical protein HRR76_002928 [Exophiala dermatitidis]KAJ4565366.1 hypothetical protein HRR79_005629 [Exophiala dermatitidis]
MAGWGSLCTDGQPAAACPDAVLPRNLDEPQTNDEKTKQVVPTATATCHVLYFCNNYFGFLNGTESARVVAWVTFHHLLKIRIHGFSFETFSAWEFFPSLQLPVL